MLKCWNFVPNLSLFPYVSNRWNPLNIYEERELIDAVFHLIVLCEMRVSWSSFKYWNMIKYVIEEVVCLPHDNMTSPRYKDPQRNTNDIIPLKVECITKSNINYNWVIIENST